MDLENMYLTRYLHCPNCNSTYIIMDCEIIACPICNLFRFKKIQEFKRGISTPILNKCNYVPTLNWAIPSISPKLPSLKII